MGEKITFKRLDGKECSGYYAEPDAGSGTPGVVVIQEWWGLNDQIKGVADRLAESGYRSLVPDLYRGNVTLDAAEAEHMMSDLDFADAATQDIRSAVRYLKSSSPKVAVLGYCMGGALAVLAAVYVGEADAVVCWYGVPPEEARARGRSGCRCRDTTPLKTPPSRQSRWTRWRIGSGKAALSTSSIATGRGTPSATRTTRTTLRRPRSLPGGARSAS